MRLQEQACWLFTVKGWAPSADLKTCVAHVRKSPSTLVLNFHLKKAAAKAAAFFVPHRQQYLPSDNQTRLRGWRFAKTFLGAVKTEQGVCKYTYYVVCLRHTSKEAL